MPHLARLDKNGTLVAVEDCCADDHRTCHVAGTVALDDGHDMQSRVNGYRFDFNRGCFLPLSAEPLDAADRNTPELVEALVLAVETLAETFNVKMPYRAAKALKLYRDRTPRRPHPADGEPE